MIKTTVIGSFPKPSTKLKLPNWFDTIYNKNKTYYNPSKHTSFLDHHNEIETIALLESIKEVITVQENRDIDVLTDGELKRENFIYYHLRHLSGISFKKLVQKKIYNGLYNMHVPTIISKINHKKYFLLNDYKIAKLFTTKAIKITIPGPLSILDMVNNKYYENNEDFLYDISTVINKEIKHIAKHGCKYIQIDDPLFLYSSEEQIKMGIKYLSKYFEGISDNVTKIIHISSGYLSKITSKKKFNVNKDIYNFLLPLLDNSIIDQISLEDAYNKLDLNLFNLIKKKKVILGVIDISSNIVEKIDDICNRILLVLEIITPERLIVSPDCGFGLLTFDKTVEKLDIMQKAVNRVNIMIEHGETHAHIII